MTPQGRRRLPDEREAFVHRVEISGGYKAFIVVGVFEDGTPGEVFFHIAKEGSPLSGMLDNFAVAISMLLQRGAPLGELVEKFAGTRFEPSGRTNNPDIRDATSITDYLFRWLGRKFLPPEEMTEILQKVDAIPTLE